MLLKGLHNVQEKGAWCQAMSSTGLGTGCNGFLSKALGALSCTAACGKPAEPSLRHGSWLPGHWGLQMQEHSHQTPGGQMP